ncbi:MAG: sigma-54-dependent Fis family transcriptional regulator [Myxococcales bacterium]|nr:sigma-54-dependent Fis family transcriptional regulator [Myxococcales bacterium]
MRKSSILVVDDEKFYRSSLQRILARVGHDVSQAADAGEALAMVAQSHFDLVVTDMQMPGVDGLQLVAEIHGLRPDLPCIIVTGFGSPESSVEALRAGAFWYLEKPFEQKSLDVIRSLVEQAIEHGRLKAENRNLQGELRFRYRFDSVVGTSAPLRELLALVMRVAATDSTALITGESGTGKELVARAIHFNSERAERPLVTVNCGAIPEELLESELFGHVKGAFTSAMSHREGRFSAAHSGTIFLDEIGDMSPNLQVKLLRVLQDRSFEPVGSSETISVDARVIAATNQDLEKAMEEGRFRADLFYRLNVVPIQVPALRERREDIPQLVEHFLAVLAHERGSELGPMSDEALEVLCGYDWPGNIRELENLIERLTVLGGKGRIEASDLPASPFRSQTPRPSSMRLPSEGLSLRAEVEQLERDLITQALEHTQGNKNRAAKLLGLNRTTLFEKIEKIKKKGLSEPA